MIEMLDIYRYHLIDKASQYVGFSKIIIDSAVQF